MDQAQANQILDKMAKLRKGGIMKPGNAGAEVEYNKLYQRLVKAGHAPQLRTKYREA